MNISLNKKVPPSSSSSICRKPLFDLTNLPSKKLLSQKGSFSRPDSTKSIRSGISIGEVDQPKLKEVHSRKNSSSNSLESNSNKSLNFCKNHRNRTAMHQIVFERAEYFCFECSLIYARQGYKIKAIKINNEQNCQFQREKQTNSFLEKCTVVQRQIIEWKRRQNCAIKEIYNQYSELIRNEKIRMQSQIQKITEGYQLTIKTLENSRQQKINNFRQIDKVIEGMSKKIETIKLDIQNNYEDCIHIFNANQYRAIMNKYWTQTQQFQTFYTQNSVQNLNKKSLDMKGTVRTMGRSGNQFTFSKEPKFDTPPFSKEIRGIKLVQSNPDSNRYESSDKESIVDAKINFNDFHI